VLDRNYNPREAVKFYAWLQGASRSDTRAGLGFVADVTRVIERTPQLRTQIATMQTALDAKPQLLVGAFNLAETLRSFNGRQSEEDHDRPAQNSTAPGRRLNLTENAEARLAALSQAMSARTGELIARIERGELAATSAEFQTVMSDVKRDNGIRAFQFDIEHGNGLMRLMTTEQSVLINRICLNGVLTDYLMLTVTVFDALPSTVSVTFTNPRPIKLRDSGTLT
jgi:hypothetical protein